MEKKEVNQLEALQLLKDLLSTPSVNGNDDERMMARFVYELFLENGIYAELQEIDGRHANVIAILEGNQENKTVIWNGHLDTVSYGNLSEWSTDPSIAEVTENRIYARGASDMKSGLAAMIYALITLKRKGIKPESNICFIGTCDEEKGGLGAAKIFEKGIMKDTQALIIGEPTDCCLGVVQKGCIWLELTVYGKTSHGAYPNEGCNSIEYGYEAASQLKRYIEQYHHPILGASTAQITMIQGGIAPNMTPDFCTFLMDIRIVPKVDLQMVIHELECICMRLNEAANQKIKFEFHIKNNRIPIETAQDNEWVDKFRRVLQAQGLTAREIGINYFTDASILVKDHPELPVLLFGPGEPNMAHKPNEWVSIDKYYQCIDTLLTIFGGIVL